ncbi:MAG: C1 family peptidase [Hyphomonas sp.]|nr:C1 family peptidase [Hyphomonas sp.]
MGELINGVYLGGCLDDDSTSTPPQVKLGKSVGLPERVDLRGMCSPVEDQRTVGSCSANAVVGALEYHLRKNKVSAADLSRLFVFYNARAIQHRENEMHGSAINLNMVGTMIHGACPEVMWPYQEALVTTRPTEACFAAAGNLVGVNYARVENGDPTALKVALVNGLPVVFGVQIPWDGYAAGARGAITKPPGGWWPRKTTGGHAILLVGYDDAKNAWLVRNSWGTKYGEGGYFWLDYDGMEFYKMADHFWLIGAIDGQPGLNMMGPSMEAHLQEVGSRYGLAMEKLAALRQSVRGTIETDLDRTRQSIRDRLRGPGAGGGY